MPCRVGRSPRRCRGRPRSPSPTPGYCTLTATSTTVAGDGAMDLTDAGCGDRDDLPIEEDSLGRLPELVGDHSRPRARRHRRRVGLQAMASACWASSGSASTMKLSSWPNFISAPFMLPSSRATSSAVRIANCWSSRSRSRRRRCARRRTRWATKRAAVARRQPPHAGRAAPADERGSRQPARRRVGREQVVGKRRPVTSSVQYVPASRRSARPRHRRDRARSRRGRAAMGRRHRSSPGIGNRRRHGQVHGLLSSPWPRYGSSSHQEVRRRAER